MRFEFKTAGSVVEPAMTKAVRGFERTDLVFARKVLTNRIKVNKSSESGIPNISADTLAERY